MQSVAHKLAHGLVGCATGAIAGSCAGGAAGAVTAETVAELMAYKDIQLLASNPNMSQSEVSGILARIQGNDKLVAQLSGVAAGLMVSDGKAEAVTVANQSAGTALDNNWIPLVMALSAVGGGIVYSNEVGNGNIKKGLEKIGEGNDPLSKAVASGVEKAVSVSMQEFPEETRNPLMFLQAMGDVVNTTVTYWDDKTGNYVSKNWNSIPEATRNQLIGAGKIASVAFTAAGVGQIASLKTISKTPDIKVTSYIKEHNPTTSAGPLSNLIDPNTGLVNADLSQKVVNSFRSGTYAEVVNDSPTTLYRVYSNSDFEIGGYWTTTPPTKGTSSIIDFALNPAFDNQATKIVQVELPPGTRYYEAVEKCIFSTRYVIHA